MAPAAPKPPVNFSSSLTIPKEASLTGTHSITMQAETIIHPRARFDSTHGSIYVGRRCIIHERVQVGNNQHGGTEDHSLGGVTLGDYVVVEVGSIIEPGGTEIGEGTTIQIGSKIGRGAKLGKVWPYYPFPRVGRGTHSLQNCTVTPRSVIAPGEVVPDCTVVYSNGQRRIDKRRVLETKNINLVKQINIARKMIRSDPDKFK